VYLKTYAGNGFVELVHSRSIVASGFRWTLRLILGARRPAAPFYGCRHPSRRSATALGLASGDALQHEDSLFDLVTLLAEIGEHL
jgi:hypothetical protein